LRCMIAPPPRWVSIGVWGGGLRAMIGWHKRPGARAARRLDPGWPGIGVGRGDGQAPHPRAAFDAHNSHRAQRAPGDPPAQPEPRAA
jgi:hypothetical protein